jgi:hypothetical protein
MECFLRVLCREFLGDVVLWECLAEAYFAAEFLGDVVLWECLAEACFAGEFSWGVFSESVSLRRGLQECFPRV